MKQFKPSKVQQVFTAVPEPFETQWQYSEYIRILKSQGLSTNPPESGGYTQEQLRTIAKVMGRVPQGYNLDGVIDQYLNDTPELALNPAFVPLTPVRVSLLPKSVQNASDPAMLGSTTTGAPFSEFSNTRFATPVAHRVSGGQIVNYATPVKNMTMRATPIRAENISDEPWAINLESLDNLRGTLIYDPKPIGSASITNIKQGINQAAFDQAATSGSREQLPVSVTQDQFEVNTSNIRFNRFPEIDITAKQPDSLGRNRPAGATARARITQATPETLIPVENFSDIPVGSQLIINGHTITIRIRSAEGFVNLVNSQVPDVEASLYSESGVDYVVLQSKTTRPLTFANGKMPGTLSQIADFSIVRDRIETEILGANSAVVSEEVTVAGRGYRVGDRLRLVGGEPVSSESGALGEIVIQNPGAGYVNPDQIEIIINPGNDVPGRGARAVVTELTEQGGIRTIQMLSLGAGYNVNTPPRIQIRDLGGAPIAKVVDAAWPETETVPAGKILRIEATEWLTDVNGALGTTVIHRRHVRTTAPVDLGQPETATISGTYTFNTTGAPNRVTISDVNMNSDWAKNIRLNSYVEITTDVGTKLMWIPAPLDEQDTIISATGFQVQVPEFTSQADVDAFFTGTVTIETRSPWWLGIVGSASERPKLVPCPDPDIVRNPAQLSAVVGSRADQSLIGPARVAKFLVTDVNSQGSITAMRMLDPGKYQTLPQDNQEGTPLEYDYASPGLPSTPESALILEALRNHTLGVADPSAGHTQYGTSANPASLAAELVNLQHPDWTGQPEFYWNGTEYVPYTGTPGAYDPETFVQVDTNEFLRKTYQIDLVGGEYLNTETLAGGTNAAIRITQAPSDESVERSIVRETLDLPEKSTTVHQPRHLVRIFNRALRAAGYSASELEFIVDPLSDKVSVIQMVSSYPTVNLTSATPGVLSALGLPEGDFNTRLLCVEASADSDQMAGNLPEIRQQQSVDGFLTNQLTGATRELRDKPVQLSLTCVRDVNTDADNLTLFARAPVQSRVELFKYSLLTPQGDPVRLSGDTRQSTQVNIFQSRRYNTGNSVPELPGNPFYRADGTGLGAQNPLTAIPHAWLDDYQGTGWAYFQNGRLVRQQEGMVDVNKLGRSLIYDAETGKRVTDLHVFDPFKGVLPGFIRNEITHISDTDPVGYNSGRTQFGKPQVGQVWWDTSTLRYEWYEQGSNQQRRARWGKLFPGSTITISEWVESRSLPANWSGDGEPRYQDRYITERRQDPVTGKYELFYYYWVQNRVELDPAVQQSGRKFDCQTLARYIANPQAYGLTLLNVVNSDAIALSNMADYVNHSDNHLQITVKSRNKLDGIDHTAWKLMREGDRISLVPDHISRKLIDSLAGENAIGQLVPDPNLSVVERLGIQFRPRQTMFDDLSEARRVMQSTLNRILAGIRLNSQFAGWNRGFPANMQYIRTINWYAEQGTDPVTNEVIRFSDDDKPVFTVSSQDELYTLRNLPDGTIVQVDSNDRARSELWKFQAITGRFDQIAVFAETIRLRDSIWQDEPNAIQSQEIRLVLEALRDRVFVNTDQWNEFFFSMLKHAYVEQGQLSWAFKTSFLYVEKQESDLTQVTGFKADNFSRILDYMNEVKPYSAKIREYRDGKRAPLELIGQNNISDYDKPPYVDLANGEIRILDDLNAADRAIMANDARFIDYFSAPDKSKSPIRRIKNTLAFDRTNWRLTDFDWNPTSETENFSIARNIVSLWNSSPQQVNARTNLRAVDRIFRFDPEVEQTFRTELTEFFNDFNAADDPDITGNVQAIQQVLDAGQLNRTLALVKEKVGGGFRGDQLDGGFFSRNQQRTEFLIDQITEFGWDNQFWDENTDGDTNVLVDDRNADNYGVVTSVGIGDIPWDNALDIISYEGVFGDVDANIAFRVNNDIIDGFDGVTFQRVLYGEERPEEMILLSPLEGMIMTVTTRPEGLQPAGQSFYDPGGEDILFIGEQLIFPNPSQQSWTPPIWYRSRPIPPNYVATANEFTEFYWINTENGYDSLENDTGANVSISDWFAGEEPGSWDLIISESDDELELTPPVSDDAQTVTFRIHQDLLGGTEYYRVRDDNTVTLVNDLDIDSEEIVVDDDKFLRNATTVNPGELWINGELIQYGRRFNNVVSLLVRGVKGTTIQPHAAGSKVFDAGDTERFTQFGARANVWITSTDPQIPNALSLSDRGNLNIFSLATDGDGVWVATGFSGIATRSADNGETWAPVNLGSGLSFIRAVATDGDGVWVAAGRNGVMFRSTDNGETWASVSSEFGLTQISALATDGDGVWVASGRSGVMTRSEDNGETWTPVTSGFAVTARIKSVATDGDGVWVATGSSGIVTRSEDNGENWTAITSGFGTQVNSVATDGDGVWVAVADSGQIRRSDDNGETWAPVTSGFLASHDIISVSTDSDGVWVAAGAKGIMYRSADNGETWLPVQSRFPSNRDIMAVATDGDGVWVAAGRSGVMTRSADNGETWTPVISGFPLDQNVNTIIEFLHDL